MSGTTIRSANFWASKPALRPSIFKRWQPSRALSSSVDAFSGTDKRMAGGDAGCRPRVFG